MVKNIIIILIILAILILSQQPFLKEWGIEMQQKALKSATLVWQRVEDFVRTHILSRFFSEIEKREQIAKEELRGQAESASQNLWGRAKNYVLRLFSQTPKIAPSH